MVIRTIKYTDLDGEDRTATMMFNFNTLDRLHLVMKRPHLKDEWTGIFEGLRSDNKDEVFQAQCAFVTFIEDIVRESYGIREGDSFMKRPDMTEKFIYSEVYAAFIISLLNNPEGANAFMKQLIPDADWNSIEGKSEEEIVKLIKEGN